MLEYNNSYDTKWCYSRFKADFSNIQKTLYSLLKIKIKKDISIVFVNEKLSCKINKAYRNKNKPTDVISFAFDEGLESVSIDSSYLGEIIICVDKVKSQAKEYGHSQRREMCFLFLHGLLHILGYDHQNKKDEKIMFNLQNKVLNNLKITR